MLVLIGVRMTQALLLPLPVQPAPLHAPLMNTVMNPVIVIAAEVPVPETVTMGTTPKRGLLMFTWLYTPFASGVPKTWLIVSELPSRRSSKPSHVGPFILPGLVLIW